MLTFLHLPKTGGHSFKQLLVDRFGPDGVAYANGLAGYRALRRDWQRGRWQALHGHMPIGVPAALGVPEQYFVVLRDPVDRFVSDYYHLVNTPAHPNHQVVVEQRITLREYAAVPCHPVSRGAQNGQVRRLATYDLDAVAADGSHWWSGAWDADRSTLEQAKRNLRDRVRHIGLVERMDESMSRFADLLGLSRVRSPRENVSPQRVEVSSLDRETVAAIRAANQLDLELYDYAQELFERQAA